MAELLSDVDDVGLARRMELVNVLDGSVGDGALDVEYGRRMPVGVTLLVDEFAFR